MKYRKSHGFTLIELLIVIAIISILAAILFPFFASAREKSRQSHCLSNLKQLGLAMDSYVQDYERYPGAGQADSPGGDWVPGSSTPIQITKGVLYDYVNTEGVFTCPSDPDRFTAGLSYRMNQKLAWQADSAPSNICDTIVLIESPVRDACFRVGGAVGGIEMPRFKGEKYTHEVVPTPINTVHVDETSVLFADGHVRALGDGQITANMFDLD